MVTDPHGDAGVVQDLTDVVRVDAVDDERHRATAVDRSDGPMIRTPAIADSSCQRQPGEPVPHSGDGLHAERLDR